jgi:glucose-6-phosphate isomerase
MVFTTVEGSKMHAQATEKQIDVLFMPDQVGGRYSILSAVGLFPLALAGINIEGLRRGAANMRDICGKKTSSEENPAMISASILYLLSREGKNINDNFIFLPQFESMGKWYRQLMGESIGKEGKGITPTVSMGSVDLHSVAQLYLDGPNDKITTFITGTTALEYVSVPESLTYNIVPAIRGKKIFDIMQAIVGGTMIAYHNQGRAYTHIGFEKLDEESMGEFMQFKMLEMMYLGKLFQVNTFDQPAVEIYKVETKKLLEG